MLAFYGTGRASRGTSLTVVEGLGMGGTIRENGKLLQDFLKTIDLKPRKTIYFLIDINKKIYDFLNYNIRLEPGVQSCEETLERKNGSCRDFAWLFVQVMRHLGLGARFVSGYLVQLKADEKSLDGPSGPEEDFTDLHAWAEVYIPGAGWIGFDATSGLLAGEGHIPLACTPSFESAAPVSGLTDVCETEFFFNNSVKRIFESPRVTKPYTEEQCHTCGYYIKYRHAEALRDRRPCHFICMGNRRRRQ